jgi:hypothetical protein
MPFAPSGRASGPRSHAPRARRSSGRWKSGWLNSTNGSSKWTRTPASCPAGGAARVGWPESCRSRRVRSGRGKRPALKPGDHPRQTSNAEAAGPAGVAEVAAAREAAIDRAPVGSRSRFRVSRVLSGGRREGSAGTPHPDPPGEPPHPEPPGEPPHPHPPPQGGREMSRSDGGGGGGGEDAAPDRTVRRQVAARRVAGQRQADTPGHANSPE